MTGIILLAAGESKRFGSPKQLAHFRGKPLLRHTVETALEAGLGPVNVVLGAVDQPCRDILAGMEVNIIHHAGWKKGMGGSISVGIRPWMGRRNPLKGVIVLLGDQPGVTAAHLRVLAVASAGHSIVAAAYGGQLGAPAWFAPDKFTRLLLLEGEKGAKTLIAREPRVRKIDIPAAAYDIDTLEDLPKAAPAADAADLPDITVSEPALPGALRMRKELFRIKNPLRFVAPLGVFR
ncbi:MAG: 4-diphosphocytidyl-2C-methyl-D-erythritol synthase [Verrucomicrobiales bacterium]|nr:4-diphosphocytidyl-2C-methyl-D-erythritol synthase [Verrucomicrobiales bacterium]